MKVGLILCLSFATYCFAADPPSTPAKNPGTEPKPEQVKRLGSVTWDPIAHKLAWIVQTGTLVNGEFNSAAEQQYEVSPDEATMGMQEEKRGFDASEAHSLQHLLDILSLYCAESVVWWDQGEGVPVTPNAAPGGHSKPSPKTAGPSDPKPVKVHQPEPKKQPYHVPDTDLVGQAIYSEHHVARLHVLPLAPFLI